MSVSESNVMVNPMSDSNHFKQIDVETSLVNLISSLKQLNALKEFILKTQAIDEKRIAFFKEELATGRYQILSKNIAKKMIADGGQSC